jgi:hypothetical protein
MRLVSVARLRSPATLRSGLRTLRLRMPLRRLPRLRVLFLPARLPLRLPLRRLRMLSLLVVLLPRRVRLRCRLAPLRLRLPGLCRLALRRGRLVRWLRLPLRVRRLRGLALRRRTLVISPLLATGAVIVVRVRGTHPERKNEPCAEPHHHEST